MIIQSDIFIFGLGMVVNGILGFLAYFANPKNFLNIGILLVSLFSILWSFFNYLYNYPGLNSLSLWFLRIHMFFAVWYAFSIFNISYINLNNDKKPKFSKIYLVIFLFSVIFSLLSLTPFVFEEIIKFSIEGRIEEVKTGAGIKLFGLFLAVLLGMSILNFVKKITDRSINDEEKVKNLIVAIGFLITFLLHVIFNFVLPNVYKNTKFLILGPLFSIPFIVSLIYLIMKFKFLNIRILITDIFIGTLLVLTASQFLSSKSFTDAIFRILIFILVFVLAVILIRTVRREVEQREELERLNKKLEELNKIKSEFLSFASHQIKAPMAVIKGYAELIQNVVENVPPQAKDFAAKIRKAVDSLLVLIEEFMDYRRIDEGRMEFNFEKLDVVSMVKEIYNNMFLLAKEKNLEFSFQSDVDFVFTNVDKVRFSQVIQNLIDNAIKYTKSGFVKIVIEKKDDRVLICVSDSGIGMSKEFQEKLFGQFVRDPSIKKEIRGTGLGLFIAKFIIEAHKGKIWAESEGEGKGSRFYVELPILNL